MNLFNDIRLFIALVAAKAYIFIAHLLGKGATTLPGALALRIYPGIIARLAKQLPNILLVTGTNGKTTTNNMIDSVFTTAGWRMVCNWEGANLATGIATALVRATNFAGKIKADAACFEVDEASFPRLAAALKPDQVLITNFSKDQLDRYGDINTLISRIQQSIKELAQPPLLILNADDAAVAAIGRAGGGAGDKLVYFGLSAGNDTGSPNPDIYAKIRTDGSNDEIQLGIYGHRHRADIALPTRGAYNAYNALAAFAAGQVYRISNEDIIRGIEGYRPAAGRMERFVLGNKTLYLNLVKNPAGANASLQTMLDDPGKKDLLIALNDKDADGKDIAWIWDVDYEMLAHHRQHLGAVYFTGTRPEELALRAKYAGFGNADPGVKDYTVQRDLAVAVKGTISGGHNVVYLLTSYTALSPIRDTLVKLGAKEQHGDVKGTARVPGTA